MAISVDIFKQQVGNGDYARPNLFEVLMPIADNARFYCKTASLPAATVNLVEVPYQNRKWKIPGDRIFADWTVTIINDQAFEVRQQLIDWQRHLQGFATIGGLTNIVDDVHQVLTVIPLDRDMNGMDHAVVEFYAWPQEIGTVELSWETPDAVQEYTVTFAVSWDTGGSPDRIS